jgi:transcriptional regulator with XRE-family HTH domain
MAIDSKEVASLKIDNQLGLNAVLGELGTRIARRRLDLGITQAEVAAAAGLGKRTVERIEAGGDSQMSTFVRLLRALDLIDRVERLVPEATPRPMDLLKLKGKERKRASSKQNGNSIDEWNE